MRGRKGDARRSFNPCCSGSASRTINSKTYNVVGYSFNPCCSGSASRTARRGSSRRRGSSVSILVVLDQPLGHSRRDDGRRPCHCFNPCCSGSASRTQGVSELSPRGLDVSILVVLDQPLGLDCVQKQLDPQIQFQSLLFWISL